MYILHILSFINIHRAFQEALLLLKEAMTAKFSALSQLALPFILCNTFLRDIIEQPHAFLVKSKDIGNVDSCEPLFKQIADLVCSKSFIETSPLALSLFAKLTVTSPLPFELIFKGCNYCSTFKRSYRL